MRVQKRIEVIRKTNETFVAMMNDLSVDELNAIPDGFSNNIIWNFAHSLAVQQAFFYALSKLPYTINEEFINRYKKGSRPQGKVEENEIRNIIGMFADAIDRFESDYEMGIFKEYHIYATSIGFVLTNIDEAIQAASFHDGWHFGYARAIKKLVTVQQGVCWKLRRIFGQKRFMTTKLNLTIEEATAKKIKAYAEKKKTSVSRIAEDYFNQLTAEKNGKKKKSFVEEFAGIATRPIGDLDKVRDEYLKEKYGR